MEELEALRIEHISSRFILQEGLYTQGVSIQLIDNKYMLFIELSHEEAMDLHAWLDLYLYPDMPNPCPDGFDECK